MNTNYCDAIISKDIAADCKNLITRGVESRGVIMNRSDIDFDQLKYNAIRGNVVEDLVLNADSKGFQIIIPGAEPFSGTGSTLGEGILNTMTNTVGIIILANDPDVCGQIIDGLMNGSFVVIVENRYKNINKDSNKGDGIYQIYGLSTGLRATTLEHDKYSTDTNGGWNVVLTEEGAPASGIFLYATDLATTRALFESLTA